jgi:hypothetical protein
MGRILRSTAVAMVVVALSAGTSGAHTAGGCVSSTDADRCETWSQVYDEPPVAADVRSDQFPSAVAASAITVFTTVKSTALDPRSPYDATAAWVVLAHDRATGALQWTARRTERPYESPLAVVVSPDGRRVYVAGSSYNQFPINAGVDSRITTVAYDAATGQQLWAASWDGRPDGTDAGKHIAVTPDGRTVVVGGVTQGDRGLDYVTIAYDTRRGRQLWARTADGPKDNDPDSLNGIAVDPGGRRVYVTGEAAGVAEYDLDYLTIAYDLRHGRPAWEARYDGVGQHKQDRADAVTVSPDGSTVYVTGNSYGSYADRVSQFDYATVAYSAADGRQRWATRSGGARRGFNAPIGVVATEDRVVVTGQARGATAEEGRDFGTFAYDAASGAEAWRATYAPVRHDEVALALALSEDGTTAYVTGSSSPTVQYTNLDEVATVAYGVADGQQRWASRLDVGAGNAVSPRASAATADGLAVAATITRSADPLKPPSQNIYDTLIVAY